MLRAVGGFLALGTLTHVMGSKATKAWLQRPVTLKGTGTVIRNPLYGFIRALNIPQIMSDGSKAGMDAWHAATQWGRAAGDNLRRGLEPHFTDQLSKSGAMHALDEGPLAPRMASAQPSAASGSWGKRSVERPDAQEVGHRGCDRRWQRTRLVHLEVVQRTPRQAGSGSRRGRISTNMVPRGKLPRSRRSARQRIGQRTMAGICR